MTMRGNPETDPSEPEAEEVERAPVTAEARIAALLDEARAARSAKDLTRAHALYTQAAALGSTDADYALGVFALAGQVVARDPRVGATHLRRAADQGHLQARVHLANVLDTGTVAGQPEPERAALFIRGVARSLGLAGTETAADRRALAEAGVGRFIAEIEDGTYEETERWNKKARALGFGRRGLQSEPDLSAMTASDLTPAPLAPPSTDAASSARPLIEPPPKPKVKPNVGPSRGPSAGEALAAAGFASLFLGAGWGIAFAATEAAQAAIEMGQVMPVLGTRIILLWPIAVGLVGVLPALLFYRGSAWLRSFGVALVTAFAGFMLHGTGKLLLVSPRELQALALGSAAFWLSLLVFGFAGGAKSSAKRASL